MTRPHAPSVKPFSSVLALRPRQPVQVKPKASTGQCPMLHSTTIMMYMSVQSASPVSLGRIFGGLQLNSLLSAKTLP